MIINSERPPEAFSFDLEVKVATVDASGIALGHGLGSRTAPIVNTAIVGALARCTALVCLSSVKEAVEEVVPEDPEKNRAAVEEAFQKVRFPSSEVVGERL
jgi:pyruvate ferredoxin oxidoreductase gamma subunit/2-oxoisovalerate ferredoxin oxidoreductase gamma subunit